ncbi:MAG: carbohydrate ABC transporter permease [Anaerolineaceae bacterium]|nr:MAG: carbohydrate ABC transporter permease [Anaerolineaceae bacterium]
MRHLIRSLRYVPLVLVAIFYLMPIYVLLATSFKSFQEVNLATMWDLPSGIYTDNFVAAFDKLAPNLQNSLKLAIMATILSSALGSLNGYVLSKWTFRGANLLFTLVLFGMFIPYQSILIPLVRFMQSIKLYGSVGGLVLVHVIYGIPITTLIFRNYFATVPNEVVEASHIDGAGFFGIYRHIMLPLAAPAFVVVMIWQFTSIWNEFLFAVTLTGPRSWPITVALQNLAGSQIVEWNVQMAGAFLAALPTLLVYIFLGRFFLRGLMAGALK